MSRVWTGAVFAIALIGSWDFAAAELLTAAPAGLRLVEASDANYVQGGEWEADQVQFPAGTIYVKRSDSLDTARKGYLRFALDDVDLSPYLGDDPQPAYFGVATSMEPAADYLVDVYGLLPGAGDWQQTTITWNNAPGNVNTIDGHDPAAASLIDHFAVHVGDAAGTVYHVEVPDLADYLQPDRSLTLLLIVNSQSLGHPSLALAAPGNPVAEAPALLLVPEPSSILLLAAAGLALLLLRRLRR